MRYLLDTNACIVYLNQENSGVRRRLASVSRSEAVLCSVEGLQL